jgi:Flp pilus assembly protein TadD
MQDAGAPLPNYSLLFSRYSGSNQWDRAHAVAREWLAADPENPRAAAAAGQALINLGRAPEAETHVRRVLQREPENDFALRLLSIVCFKRGRFQEADDAIHRAISIQPHDAYHWYHLGQMCHSQGDLDSGRRFAARAREIRPRDANIVNLLAMCERPDARDQSAQLRHYQEALELDPENSVIHNNIGVYYLNVEKDYRAAEAAFRRALHFEPARALFRSNLFITLKHRDPVYRILCAPRDFFLRIAALSRGKTGLRYLLVLTLWILLGYFLLIGLILWGVFIWPLVKVYERLTVGDIRAKAGEIGARRGGWFGFHRWPVRVRLGLFAAILVGFWGGVIFLVCHAEDPSAARGYVVLAFFAYVALTNQSKGSRADQVHARRRAKRFRDILAGPPVRKPPLAVADPQANSR